MTQISDVDIGVTGGPDARSRPEEGAVATGPPKRARETENFLFKLDDCGINAMEWTNGKW